MGNFIGVDSQLLGCFGLILCCVSCIVFVCWKVTYLHLLHIVSYLCVVRYFIFGHRFCVFALGIFVCSLFLCFQAPLPPSSSFIQIKPTKTIKLQVCSLSIILSHAWHLNLILQYFSEVSSFLEHFKVERIRTRWCNWHLKQIKILLS